MIRLFARSDRRRQGATLQALRRSPLRLAACVAACVASGAAAAAAPHGGVYRGPGSTIGPGGATAGGPASTSAGAPDTDSATWSRWWSLNRDRYLGLRGAVQSGLPSTGDADFYLGRGGSDLSREGLVPSPESIRDRVVPALLSGLTDRDIDIRTGCMLALAKIGQEAAGGEHDLGAALIALLPDSNQEVHESAAIALGVLASPSLAPTLADLVHDTERGRELVGRGRVSRRARAFAVYGLGLIGNRATNESIRRYVVHHLAQVLDEGGGADLDLGVAAILSMGLVPLPDGELPDPEGATPRPTESRQAQISYLLELFERSGPRGLDARVRAYVPVAVARLATGAAPSLALPISRRLVEAIAPRSREDAVVQHGAVHALGILGDGDEDPHDVAIRRALLGAMQNGDRIARNLAMVSLARCAARPGEGRQGDGQSEAREALLKELARGTSAGRPWAALALGLFEHDRLRRQQTASQPVAVALRQRFRSEGSPAEAGALAIAIGLAENKTCVEELVDRLHSGDENVRGYCATSLGLMQATEAIEPLSDAVRRGTFSFAPSLLREWAIALAMLGDKSAVPMLVRRLKESKALMEQVSLAAALGRIGDARAVDPLLETFGNERLSDTTRAFAAVALGVICDKEPLPWNAKFAADAGWWNAPPTLLDPLAGKGILDLF